MSVAGGRAVVDRAVRIRPGLRLAVREWQLDGESVGRPFLLVHGLASNARLWDGVAARLAAAGHRVVAVDQRGHGRSDAPDEGYDFATVTEDLRLLSRACDLAGGVAVGQSWGGNVVLEAAARWEDGLVGAVAVDGGTITLQDRFPDWEDCLEQMAPPRFEGVTAAAMEQRLRSTHPDWPEEGIAGAMANFAVLPDGTVTPHLRRDRHLRILRALWEHRPAERYAQIGVPVLLIPADTGAAAWTADKRRDVESAAAALERARVRWIVGDHDLHAQHPAVVADLLRGAVADGFFG